MNAQEKKLHINITWQFVKGALLFLATLLGKDGLIEKIKDLLDGNDTDDDVVTADGLDPHGCKSNEYWDEEKQKCILKAG